MPRLLLMEGTLQAAVHGGAAVLPDAVVQQCIRALATLLLGRGSFQHNKLHHIRQSLQTEVALVESAVRW